MMRVGNEVVMCTAESLGVILYCEFCDVAICEWDGEKREWTLDLTEPDEQGKIACWNCIREKVTPPTYQQVEELLRPLTIIAALYVEHGGAYYGLDNVLPHGLPERDARAYDGPWPIVAHPPCERWGVFWSGGPLAHEKRMLGDDGGCFRAAIAAVRKFGGVIEHPRGSHAWEVFGIKKPKKGQGWIVADEHGGFTCCVEQGAYGHKAKKPTWLYVCHVPREDLPELTWVATGVFSWFGGDGYKSREERQAAREMGFVGEGKYMPKRERAATPVPFRDLLIDLARRVKR